MRRVPASILLLLLLLPLCFPAGASCSVGMDCPSGQICVSGACCEPDLGGKPQIGCDPSVQANQCGGAIFETWNCHGFSGPDAACALNPGSCGICALGCAAQAQEEQPADEPVSTVECDPAEFCCAGKGYFDGGIIASQTVSNDGETAIDISFYFIDSKGMRHPVNDSRLTAVFNDEQNQMQTYGPYSLYGGQSGSLVVPVSDFSASRQGVFQDGHCYSFTFFYCPDELGACPFKNCQFNFGVPADTTQGDRQSIPPLPGRPAPAKDQSPVLMRPAVGTTTICLPPPATSGTPEFCLPLFLIFAFLGAAMYLSGMNPLRQFDITAPRMKKHWTFTARPRVFSVPFSGMLGAALAGKGEAARKQQFQEAKEAKGKAAAVEKNAKGDEAKKDASKGKSEADANYDRVNPWSVRNVLGGLGLGLGRISRGAYRTTDKLGAGALKSLGQGLDARSQAGKKAGETMNQASGGYSYGAQGQVIQGATMSTSKGAQDAMGALTGAFAAGGAPALIKALLVTFPLAVMKQLLLNSLLMYYLGGIANMLYLDTLWSAFWTWAGSDPKALDKAMDCGADGRCTSSVTDANGMKVVFSFDKNDASKGMQYEILDKNGIISGKGTLDKGNARQFYDDLKASGVDWKTMIPQVSGFLARISVSFAQVANSELQAMSKSLGMVSTDLAGLSMEADKKKDESARETVIDFAVKNGIYKDRFEAEGKNSWEIYEDIRAKKGEGANMVFRFLMACDNLAAGGVTAKQFQEHYEALGLDDKGAAVFKGRFGALIDYSAHKKNYQAGLVSATSCYGAARALDDTSASVLVASAAHTKGYAIPLIDFDVDTAIGNMFGTGHESFKEKAERDAKAEKAQEAEVNSKIAQSFEAVKKSSGDAIGQLEKSGALTAEQAEEWRKKVQEATTSDQLAGVWSGIEGSKGYGNFDKKERGIVSGVGDKIDGHKELESAGKELVAFTGIVSTDNSLYGAFAKSLEKSLGKEAVKDSSSVITGAWEDCRADMAKGAQGETIQRMYRNLDDANSEAVRNIRASNRTEEEKKAELEKLGKEYKEAKDELSGVKPKGGKDAYKENTEAEDFFSKAAGYCDGGSKKIVDAQKADYEGSRKSLNDPDKLILERGESLKADLVQSLNMQFSKDVQTLISSSNLDEDEKEKYTKRLENGEKAGSVLADFRGDDAVGKGRKDEALALSSSYDSFMLGIKTENAHGMEKGAKAYAEASGSIGLKGDKKGFNNQAYSDLSFKAESFSAYKDGAVNTDTTGYLALAGSLENMGHWMAAGMLYGKSAAALENAKIGGYTGYSGQFEAMKFSYKLIYTDKEFEERFGMDYEGFMKEYGAAHVQEDLQNLRPGEFEKKYKVTQEEVKFILSGGAENYDAMLKAGSSYQKGLAEDLGALGSKEFQKKYGMSKGDAVMMVAPKVDSRDFGNNNLSDADFQKKYGITRTEYDSARMVYMPELMNRDFVAFHKERGLDLTLGEAEFEKQYGMRKSEYLSQFASSVKDDAGIGDKQFKDKYGMDKSVAVSMSEVILSRPVDISGKETWMSASYKFGLPTDNALNAQKGAECIGELFKNGHVTDKDNREVGRDTFLKDAREMKADDFKEKYGFSFDEKRRDSFVKSSTQAATDGMRYRSSVSDYTAANCFLQGSETMTAGLNASMAMSSLFGYDSLNAKIYRQGVEMDTNTKIMLGVDMRHSSTVKEGYLSPEEQAELGVLGYSTFKHLVTGSMTKDDEAALGITFFGGVKDGYQRSLQYKGYVNGDADTQKLMRDAWGNIYKANTVEDGNAYIKDERQKLLDQSNAVLTVYANLSEYDSLNKKMGAEKDAVRYTKYENEAKEHFDSAMDAATEAGLISGRHTPSEKKRPEGGEGAPSYKITDLGYYDSEELRKEFSATYSKTAKGFNASLHGASYDYGQAGTAAKYLDAAEAYDNGLTRTVKIKSADDKAVIVYADSYGASDAYYNNKLNAVKDSEPNEHDVRSEIARIKKRPTDEENERLEHVPVEYKDFFITNMAKENVSSKPVEAEMKKEGFVKGEDGHWYATENTKDAQPKLAYGLFVGIGLGAEEALAAGIKIDHDKKTVDLGGQTAEQAVGKVYDIRMKHASDQNTYAPQDSSKDAEAFSKNKFDDGFTGKIYEKHSSVSYYSANIAKLTDPHGDFMFATQKDALFVQDAHMNGESSLAVSYCESLKMGDTKVREEAQEFMKAHPNASAQDVISVFLKAASHYDSAMEFHGDKVPKGSENISRGDWLEGFGRRLSENISGPYDITQYSEFLDKHGTKEVFSDITNPTSKDYSRFVKAEYAGTYQEATNESKSSGMEEQYKKAGMGSESDSPLKGTFIDKKKDDDLEYLDRAAGLAKEYMPVLGAVTPWLGETLEKAPEKWSDDERVWVFNAIAYVPTQVLIDHGLLPGNDEPAHGKEIPHLKVNAGGDDTPPKPVINIKPKDEPAPKIQAQEDTATKELVKESPEETKEGPKHGPKQTEYEAADIAVQKDTHVSDLHFFSHDERPQYDSMPKAKVEDIREKSEEKVMGYAADPETGAEAQAYMQAVSDYSMHHKKAHEMGLKEDSSDYVNQQKDLNEKVIEARNDYVGKHGKKSFSEFDQALGAYIDSTQSLEDRQTGEVAKAPRTRKRK
ncbi:MAG: hypothetical protein ACP5NX_03150 [Candidatus Bilamarchaeaceae archaeon]